MIVILKDFLGSAHRFGLTKKLNNGNQELEKTR